MRGRFGVLSWIFSLAGALLGSQLVAAMYDNVNGPMEHAPVSYTHLTLPTNSRV